MKASVAYKTLDNITVVLLAFKNFKSALSNEFVEVNNMAKNPSESKLKKVKFINTNALLFYQAIQTCKERKVELAPATMLKISRVKAKLQLQSRAHKVVTPCLKTMIVATVD